MSKLSSFELGRWVLVEFEINSKQNRYHIRIDGETIGKKTRFAVDGQPERIIFRTGKYRLTDDVRKFKSGDKHVPGWDEPGADETSPNATYFIKNFRVYNK